MLYLLKYWRLGILAAALALYPIVYVKGRYDGARKVESRVAVDTARANSEARSLEQARQRRADEAAGLAASRANRIALDAANARASADGLRDQLDATERFAAQSRDAAAKAVATLRAVSESCAAEYRLMGQEAAGHASDSLTLQQSWPTDSTKGTP